MGLRNCGYLSRNSMSSRLSRTAQSCGEESKLSYLGDALVANRNGLIAASMAHADGYAERDAALLMLVEKQQSRSRA